MLKVTPKYVKKFNVFLHLDDVELPGQVEIRNRLKKVFRGPTAIDRRVLLEEARRTSERRNPTIMRHRVGKQCLAIPHPAEAFDPLGRGKRLPSEGASRLRSCSGKTGATPDR